MNAKQSFSTDKSASASHHAATDDAADATPPLAEGMIIEGNRGMYRVQTPEGVLLCTIRGRLRKQLEYPISATAHKRVKKAVVKEHDPVAVGDRVRVLPTGGGNGVIEEVVARAGGSLRALTPMMARARFARLLVLTR